MARWLRTGAVEPQLLNEGGKAVLPHIPDDAVSSFPGIVRAVGHAAAQSRRLQHPHIIGGIARRNSIGQRQTHGFTQISQTHPLINALPDDIIAVPAAITHSTHHHKTEVQVAVLPVERLQRLIGQAGKGGMGHIDEMAVLILAVLQVRPLPLSWA